MLKKYLVAMERKLEMKFEDNLKAKDYDISYGHFIYPYSFAEWSIKDGHVWLNNSTRKQPSIGTCLSYLLTPVFERDEANAAVPDKIFCLWNLLPSMDEMVIQEILDIAPAKLVAWLYFNQVGLF